MVARNLVTVAQIGSRMHYAVPVAMARSDRLERFYTDFYWKSKNNIINRFVSLPGPRFKRMLDRVHPELPNDKVHAFNTLGLRYQIALARARTGGERELVFEKYGRLFAGRVADKGFGKAGIFYGFVGGALESLQSASAQGVFSILEQMHIPWELMSRIYSEEYRNWPGWETTIDTSGGVDLFIQREKAEWKLADLIVTGSEFAAKGMRELGVPERKIRVMPYGVELSKFHPPQQKLDERGALKVLFVGSVSLRKGVVYLLHALQKLRKRPGLQIAAKCVGGQHIASRFLAEYSDVCEFVGHLSRSEIPHIYQWADVFVFPSICEGSATVIYEALASGLPVITTPNAGSIVRDGEEGFIVPIRDVDALAERIEQLAIDLPLRRKMREAALKRANYGSLQSYQSRLINLIHSIERSRR